MHNVSLSLRMPRLLPELRTYVLCYVLAARNVVAPYHAAELTYMTMILTTFVTYLIALSLTSALDHDKPPTALWTSCSSSSDDALTYGNTPWPDLPAFLHNATKPQHISTTEQIRNTLALYPLTRADDKVDCR